MGKKKNSALRQSQQQCNPMKKRERDYMIHTGIDESIIDDIMQTKKCQRKRKEV